MKIVNCNKEKIDSIFVHDAYMLNLIYNNELKKLSIDFISTWEEYSNLELIFNKVFYFDYQNFDLFGACNGTKIDCILLNEKKDILSDLRNKYERENEIIDEENRDSEIQRMKYSLENLDASKLMEIVICSLSGGKLTIICEEIIVNEL